MTSDFRVGRGVQNGSEQSNFTVQRKNRRIWLIRGSKIVRNRRTLLMDVALMLLGKICFIPLTFPVFPTYLVLLT